MNKNFVSGVIKDQSHVAYSFELPTLPEDPETEEYLQELAQRYRSFLEHESRSPCDFVRFGGIRFQREENTLILLAALCPFSERSFFPVARLFFDENGRLCRVQKEKRSRRKPS